MWHITGTMNVIDCLAIAPYYLTLFFFPAPELVPADGDLATPAPGVVEEEEGESGFGNVGRIMQVQYSVLQCSTVHHRAGVQDREDHEDLQAGPQVGGAPVHRPHGAHQLEGPGPAVHAGGHGHARLRQLGVLHRERGTRHWLHFDTTGRLYIDRR